MLIFGFGITMLVIKTAQTEDFEQLKKCLKQDEKDGDDAHDASYRTIRREFVGDNSNKGEECLNQDSQD